jgi:hypothetical protein
MDGFIFLDLKKKCKIGNIQSTNFIFPANWNHHHYLTLNENNIEISVITECKEKLQGTRETEHYMVIYSGYNRYPAVQLGVIIWFLNSISNKTVDINNIRSLCITESREELSEEDTG